MQKRKGYCIVEDTLFGGPILWTVEEFFGEGILPEVWDTEEEAQKELVKNYIEHLQQFVDGDRDWDDTDLGGPAEYIALIIIEEDGTLHVNDIEDGHYIMNTTVEKWKAQL